MQIFALNHTSQGLAEHLTHAKESVVNSSAVLNSDSSRLTDDLQGLIPTPFIEIAGNLQNNYPEAVKTVSHSLYPQLIKIGITDGGSYLNRHEAQMKELRDHILPLIVQNKLTSSDKRIRLASVGPGFEEQATILAYVREAFELHQEWGNINDWDIRVDGFDRSLPVLLESVERIEGRSPFCYKLAADQKVVERLNQDPNWAANSFSSFLADAKNPETISLMEQLGYDAVFMNAVFDDIDAEAAERLGGLFSTLDAFIIGDESQDAPLRYLKNHDIEYRIQEADLEKRKFVDRHTKDYAVAIPAQYKAAWHLNSTQRPEYTEPKNVDKAGLRLLVLQNNELRQTRRGKTTNDSIATMLRDNIGCWSNANSLRNAVVDEVLVENYDAPLEHLPKLTLDRVKDGYYHGVIVSGYSDREDLPQRVGFVISAINPELPTILVSEGESFGSDLNKFGFIIVRPGEIMSQDAFTPYINSMAQKAGILPALDTDRIEAKGSLMFGLGVKLRSVFENHGSLLLLSNFLNRYAKIENTQRQTVLSNGILKDLEFINKVTQNTDLESFRNFVNLFLELINPDNEDLTELRISSELANELLQILPRLKDLAEDLPFTALIDQELEKLQTADPKLIGELMKSYIGLCFRSGNFGQAFDLMNNDSIPLSQEAIERAQQSIIGTKAGTNTVGATAQAWDNFLTEYNEILTRISANSKNLDTLAEY